jgi:hypothetical protein
MIPPPKPGADMPGIATRHDLLLLWFYQWPRCLQYAKSPK